ncbi:MAG: hypothetical protein CMO74_09705 [Verrucomicrobiales bacterium]|nr:hypothetical protein [Verrucomicrobiales bacterium]
MKASRRLAYSALRDEEDRLEEARSSPSRDRLEDLRSSRSSANAVTPIPTAKTTPPQRVTVFSVICVFISFAPTLGIDL